LFHLLPGFQPIAVTQKFATGPEKAFAVGLFPLALLVPLAQSRADWKKVGQGFLLGCLGILLMAFLAISVGATQWQMKMPPFPWIVYLNNLLLVSIPEEAFFRGFLQRELIRRLESKVGGIVITSLLFTFAHIYWSPNLTTLVFVFLASLLYGGVYLWSGKIESAILSHFFLNFLHITFFTYHAL
jgi:hypothetical protein